VAKADTIRDQKTKNDLQKEYLDLNQQVLDNLVEQSDQLTFADKLLNKMFRTESKIDKLAQDKKDAEEDLSEEKINQKRLDAEAIDASQKILKDIKSRMKGFNGLAKQAKRFNAIAKANPYVLLATIILGIVTSLIAIAKAAEKTASEFGVTRMEAVKIEAKLFAARATLTGFSISAEEARASFTAIGDQLGGINNASVKLIKNVAQAAKQSGVTAEEFATILSLQESISSASRDSLISQIKLTREAINLKGVGAAAIFKDIAENTEFFAAFAKEGGKNIEEAAVQARKLGMSLTETAKVTESLLDFESSIEKQLEASLLLGREINFDKARQAAFNGKIYEAIEEVTKQLGGEAEISGLDPIAKNAVAEAVGLSVSELTRLTREREGGEIEKVKTAAEKQLEKQDKTIVLLTDIRDDTESTKRNTKTSADSQSEAYQ
jgi:hypothetical protein